LYNVKDDIVALATTPGRSAINVIRASGPKVKSLVESLFLDEEKSLKQNRCFVYNLYNPSTKELLDQSVVSFFKSPKSFTGQDVVEISAHGGVVVAKKILEGLCFLGCRHAHEGEYSYRAFINGKIDLIQAEAISNIIDTGSDIDVLFSLQNLSLPVSIMFEIASAWIKSIFPLINAR
jgi:tRNA modification GTPase